MHEMRSQTLALLLLFAASARADTLLTIKLRMETTPSPPVTENSQPDMQWQLWVGDHRTREDTPKLSTSVIRRFDRKKVYFINHRSRTYAEVDLPVNPTTPASGSQTGKPAAAGDVLEEGEQRPKEELTVTVTNEVRRIGPWHARKVIVVSRGSLGEVTAIKWMSTEVGVDEGAINQWQEDAVVLPPGSRDAEYLASERRLNAIPGYTVLQESHSSGPGGIEFRGHMELVSAEQKEPPAGLYEPPDGYTKVAFDQMHLIPAEKPEDH